MPESNQNRTVRIAVSLFFFLCVPLSLWETNVQARVFVAQDPVATATNLLSNELAFRASILSHLVGTIGFLVMALLFYKVLKSVDQQLARFMIIPIVAQLAIVFVLEALNFTALMTLKAEARVNFDVTQQQEVSYFLMRIHRYGFGADKLIFAMFFIPLGILFYRSGLAPRAVGVLMIVGGIGYVVDTCLYLLLQRSDYLKLQPIKLLSSATYALGLLWLLVRGVRNIPNRSQIVDSR